MPAPSSLSGGVWGPMGRRATYGTLLPQFGAVGDPPGVHALLQHYTAAESRTRVLHMIEEIERMVEQYAAWLKAKTSLRQLGDWVEITTPYLDRHNDYLQIYAQRRNGGFVLTDDGYVLDDLSISGCLIESAKRKKLLEATLNGFGVRQNGGALEVHVTADNFARRK